MIQDLKRSIYMLLLCLLVAGKLAAQDAQYFVYIQNEKAQPFYVKYKGKLLSSSERGYIILSELPAGTLPISIGFPKNEAPEQEFRLRLGKNDQGFLLKRTDEKSYALYNLQTFAVTMAGTEGENGRLQPLDQPGSTGDSAAQPETAATETAITPAPPADAPPAAEGDTTGTAMMAALRKEIDTAMAGKAEVTSVAKPVKKPSKFAETLDKVVSDDRPDDIVLEEPAAVAPAAAGAAATGAVVDASAVVIGGETKKARRKRNKDRAALTEEEQALLKDVLAEEKKGDPADSVVVTTAPEKKEPLTDTAQTQATSTDPAPPAASPEVTAETPAATVETPAVLPVIEGAPVKKAKKPKRKKSSDPEFIEFMDDSTQQRVSVPAAATETAAVPAPVTETPADAAVAETDTTTLTKKEKRKKRKLAEMIDATENPNNIVKDSVNYDAPARKEKESAAALKMINSDCQNMMDDATFRKLLRKVVAAKDDDGMVEAFRRNTRSYCLETTQIRRLGQLINSDEYRYKLLDMAYPKTYDSERYAGLGDLLSDSYYQGRFKAMLHK